jgi:hypothetical protein
MSRRVTEYTNIAAEPGETIAIRKLFLKIKRKFWTTIARSCNVLECCAMGRRMLKYTKHVCKSEPYQNPVKLHTTPPYENVV